MLPLNQAPNLGRVMLRARHSLYEASLGAAFDVRFWDVSSWWWHPKGVQDHKLNLAFADGHVGYTPVQFGVFDNADYRLHP